MLRSLTIVLFLIVFIACDDDNEKAPATQGVSGIVQKGPFVNGSNVTIQVLDADFNPVGKSYTVATVDDLGSFELGSTVTGKYLEFIAQGNYFNEVSGVTSTSPLTLRAIAEIKPDMESNVNVLTTLAKDRIIQLVKEDKLSFHDAKVQAEAEILLLFNVILDEPFDFNTMDITMEGDPHAVLLAISAILQGGGLTTQGVSELILKLGNDIKDNGKIDTPSIAQLLYANADKLNLLQIKNNLIAFYTKLGVEKEMPDFEKFARLIVDFDVDVDIVSNLLAWFPLNGDATDATGHGFNANAVKVSYGEGINNTACKFSGEGSYLEIPNVMNLTSKVWTYALWFRLDELSSGIVPSLLATRLSANPFWATPLYIRSSIKTIATYNGTLLDMGQNAIQLNKWHHVAMVIDNGTIKMYLDGSLRASNNNFWDYQSNPGYTDFLGDATGSYEYYTGSYYISERFRGQSYPAYMIGSVDNVRFYSRALSAMEVQELHKTKQ